MTELSSRFQKSLSDSQSGFVLKHLIERQLSRGEFADDFTVRFRKQTARKPDDYFHPSTHPLWPERALYNYLAHPDEMEPEHFPYESRMALTMGTAVHSFMEEVMRMGGHFAPREGTCPACGKPYGTKKGTCQEYGAADPETGSRGHMDGVVKLKTDGKLWDASQPGVFELKTSNEFKAFRSLRHDLNWHIIKREMPYYYAQVQEYMRMTGMRQALIFFVVLGFPWQNFEYQIPYDEEYAESIRSKYLYVRQCVADKTPPLELCCGGRIQGRECPARGVCRI